MPWNATSPVNITYFTDYYFWLDPMFKEYWMSPGASSNLGQNYAVVPLEGEPALVIGSQQAVNAADLWVRDLHLYGDTGLDDTFPPAALPGGAERLDDLLPVPVQNATSTKALLGILKARGLTEARIGPEMEGLTPPAKHALLGALPRAQVKDCSNLIRLIRAVKSRDEIERMARSAQINEQAGMESLSLARPGRQIGDVVQHFRARVAELGADFDHFGYGYQGMGIATEPEYRLPDKGADVCRLIHKPSRIMEVEGLSPINQLAPNQAATCQVEWDAVRWPGPILDLTLAGCASRKLSFEQLGHAKSQGPRSKAARRGR